MKIRDLRKGDFFQFQRQRSGEIYRVVDPDGDWYLLIGHFIKGVPSPLPDGATRFMASAPDRSVKKVNKYIPDPSVLEGV